MSCGTSHSAWVGGWMWGGTAWATRGEFLLNQHSFLSSTYKNNTGIPSTIAGVEVKEVQFVLWRIEWVSCYLVLNSVTFMVAFLALLFALWYPIWVKPICTAPLTRRFTVLTEINIIIFMRILFIAYYCLCPTATRKVINFPCYAEVLQWVLIPVSHC